MTAKPSRNPRGCLSLRPARLPDRKPASAPRPDADRVIRAFVRTLERIEGARKPQGGVR